ncbi:eukaryotic translation initiation factor 4E-like [Liolophura sinensis]|uniref:eukaryotic translation initiation factor 4E-like n=1 Tax=Liolophura sinensis TaxID=3198878 RepID=UPI003158B1EE
MASEQVEQKEESRQAEAEENDQQVVPSPELLIKHPLQNRWALWFFKNDKTKDWASNLKLITSVETVEDFWGLYNHVQKASRLPSGCDYSMFKDGIQPMWEDTQNKEGGRWLINLNKQQRHTDLDNFWLETLLCMIGEAFDEQSEDVNGAVVNIRNKGDKLAMWTKDARRGDANVKIGKKLKERLNIPDRLTIGFQAHTDTISRQGSTAKNRFSV